MIAFSDIKLQDGVKITLGENGYISQSGEISSSGCTINIVDLTSQLAPVFAEGCVVSSLDLNNYYTKTNVDSLLGSKATDSLVVHKSGNESITGTKNFASGSVVVSKDSFTKGTTPSTAVYEGISFSDKNVYGSANRIGLIESAYLTDGSTLLQLLSYKPENGSTANAGLKIYYPASGNPYITGITPATTDNSTKLATTAFVKNNLPSGPQITSYNNGTTMWFRKWSDGFIEQGGYDSYDSIATKTSTISLPTQFSGTNYSIVITGFGSQGYMGSRISAQTVSSFTYNVASAAENYRGTKVYWFAFGY